MSKPAPRFWWDMNDHAVIVQSDHPGGEELARFEGEPGKDLEPQVVEAEKLISDYESGRKTPEWKKEKSNG